MMSETCIVESAVYSIVCVCVCAAVCCMLFVYEYKLRTNVHNTKICVLLNLVLCVFWVNHGAYFEKVDRFLRVY